MPRHFLTPLLQRPKGCRLVCTRSATLLADHVLPALDRATRNTGLLKHTSLPRGHAMIIAPCSAVHTFFMKFAIDLIFVAKDGRVLKIRRHVPAWRVSARLGAFAVIELPAGTLDDAARCETGDRLELVSAGPEIGT